MRRALLVILSALAVSGAQSPVPGASVTLRRVAPHTPTVGVRAVLATLPSGVRTGLLVQDLATGRTVEALAPDVSLIPASVTKLVTAGAALAALGGADGWWSTELTVPSGQVGRPEVSTLTLRGSGDPTLKAIRGAYSLRALATQAYRRGLRRVGRVQVEDLTFQPAGWNGSALGAPMTALRLAEWHDRPPASAALARAALGNILIRELRRAGIRVSSEHVESAGAFLPSSPPGSVPGVRRPEQGVASVRSASPTVVLAATLRPSDNLRAEELLSTLARRPGAGGTLSGALSLERAFLRRIGADLSGVTLHDGSGLDRRNRLTPRALTALLRTMYDLPYPGPGRSGLPDALYRRRHNAYAELLPQAGTGENVPHHDGRGGTLALRLLGSGLDVRAKTGTLPGVSSLAGYLTARSGHVLAFAVIMNGPENTPTLSLRNAQDDLTRALAAAH